MPAIALDTLDDRREIHGLLRRLHPARRTAFLRWACSTAPPLKTGDRPYVLPRTVALGVQAERDDAADERHATEVYFDLWTLHVQYRLSLDAALGRLVDLVRRS